MASSIFEEATKSPTPANVTVKDTSNDVTKETNNENTNSPPDAANSNEEKSTGSNNNSKMKFVNVKIETMMINQDYFQKMYKKVYNHLVKILEIQFQSQGQNF